MSKIEMKLELGKAHGLECYICGGEVTQEEIEKGLIDMDRLIPKADGQSYTIDVTRLAHPLCHMDRHGTHRIRPEALGELKVLMDTREQFMKLENKINNQLRAFARGTDETLPGTVIELKEVSANIVGKAKVYEKAIKKWVLFQDSGLIKSCLNVVNLGELGTAGFLNYIVVEKAPHRSSVWKYLGLHRASHERYEKGKISGGNETLRTILWRTVDSMWKNRECPYRDVGDRVKERLHKSERMVQSYNTQGKLVTIPWKDTMLGHPHGAAYREMMKQLSGDYWVVARKFAGLPTSGTYAADMLGHNHQVDPRERGWLFPNSEGHEKQEA